MVNLEKEIFTFHKGMWLKKGFDELTAAILAMLLTETSDITMEQVMRKTGYSMASISNKVKVLANFGLVTKKTKPGAKKIYLHMEKDFLKMLKEAMVKSEEFIKYSNTEIEGIVKRNKGGLKTGKEKQQMRDLLAINNYLSKVKPIFIEFKRKLEAIK